MIKLIMYLYYFDIYRLRQKNISQDIKKIIDINSYHIKYYDIT